MIAMLLSPVEVFGNEKIKNEKQAERLGSIKQWWSGQESKVYFSF